MPRQTLTLVDEPASDEAMLPPRTAPVVIIDDRAGVAEALAAHLKAAGWTTEIADDRPNTATLGGMIDLSGLRPLSNAAAASALASHAFLRAQACYERLREHIAPLYVAVFDNGGGHGLLPEPSALSPWRSALGALAKGLRHECPGAQVKSIDVACTGLSAAQVAQRIADELLHGGHQVEIALPSNGLRYIPRLNRTPPPQTPALEVNGLVVVSGGARGITAQCVLALAQYCPGPYLLLGRSPMQEESPVTVSCPDEASLRALLLRRAKGNGKRPTPSSIDRQVHTIMAAREIQQTLAVLHDHDIVARYASVDVRDREALSTVLSKARADFGPVAALIHGAGLRLPRPLPDKSIAQFEAVFGTKADAFHALLSVMADDPLHLIAAFGSVIGRSGHAGLLDYGMGCEVINKLASAEQRRRAEQCRVVSLNWGDWEKTFHANGPAFCSLSSSHDLQHDEGAGLFVREALSGADGSVEVNYGDGFVLP